MNTNKIINKAEEPTKMYNFFKKAHQCFGWSNTISILPNDVSNEDAVDGPSIKSDSTVETKGSNSWL
jgi:hypothetical protein